MADKLERAKAAFEAAKSYHAELHTQIKEDLEFSNPADPRQWPDQVRTQRRLDGRPCQTFDYTNQYIMQVVNDQRMNKPGLNVLPVGSGSDVQVAQALEGVFRHIEYASRAGIAYDTSIELAARVGLGWLRVVPEVVDPETNEQEIRIKRVIDSRSIMLNPDSTEPDGSDATEGHVEATMSRDAFRRTYPKAKLYKSNDTKGWYSTDDVRVCEYFEVVKRPQNRLIVTFEGERMTLSEDEYWKLVQELGIRPEVVGQYSTELRVVEWTKYCGEEVFEQTEFPSIWIPLIPVVGYESFIDGRRYLCGLTRRMMDGQTAYNVARTAEVELAMMSPKQPWLVDDESVAAFPGDWANANVGGKAYLRYKARAADGEPLPVPQRVAPAPVSQGYLQLAQASLGDIEASVGMYRANLGQTSNETSGKAINARQRQGSIANYHYVDNQARSMEHMGRIIMTMIPRVMDVQRIVQCIGEDGEVKNIEIDPTMQRPARKSKKNGAEMLSINPNIGRYDVRVKVGPGYATMRQEAAEQLGQMMNNPAMAAIIGPIWARMQDWPEADKLARMLLAMAPPPVQQAAGEEAQTIPPEVQAQMQAMQQQLQQAEQVIQQMHQALTAAQQEEQAEAQKLQMEQQQFVAGLQADMAKDQNKHQTTLAVEKMRIDAASKKAEDDNDTKRAIADLTNVVKLLVAHIQPPPLLEAAASEELAENIADD